MSKDFKEKESQLIAELANRVLMATNKQRLQWTLGDDSMLEVKIQDGRALLCPCLDDPTVIRFAAFDAADKELGAVDNGHPSLRYDLADCYSRLLAKLDVRHAEHQAKVTTISAMFGALDEVMGDDVQPETSLPEAEAEAEATEEEETVPTTVEEDDVEELHDEDAEFAFQSDMAEQAEEFGKSAREEAGVEPEEPLASLPGQTAPKPPPAPAAAPSPPRMKKVIRKVKRPGGPPPPAGKSRVLDQGK